MPHGIEKGRSGAGAADRAAVEEATAAPSGAQGPRRRVADRPGERDAGRRGTPASGSRRDFLLGGSAVLLGVPLPARAALPADPDVVVIGAGAAGVAAARTLLGEGRSVVLIEAADRVGGRVHTDTAFFGVPYDTGAHWLHYAEENPFVRYGREHGFTMYESPDDEILYVGSREATSPEYEAFTAAYDGAVRAIARAGRRGRDVSPASVVPDAGQWHDTAHLLVGPWEMAKDFDRFSCADWYSGEDGTDWYCKEGFGALFAHSARDVPVSLTTRAETVGWGGPGVRVETDRGAIRARACIVTVSTGVLAHEGIRFDPPLPVAKRESFHGISMGIYNHVALLFRDNFFGVGADGYVYHKVESRGAASPEGMGVLVDASGTRLAYADVGGEFARALEREGPRAATDFALSTLRGIFGSEVDRQLVKAHATAWGSDPLARGAYASAEPGRRDMRDVLREPVGDRLWFAGEACSEDDWATVAGAHKSGVATARALHVRLG